MTNSPIRDATKFENIRIQNRDRVFNAVKWADNKGIANFTAHKIKTLLDDKFMLVMDNGVYDYKTRSEQEEHEYIKQKFVSIASNLEAPILVEIPQPKVDLVNNPFPNRYYLIKPDGDLKLIYDPVNYTFKNGEKDAILITTSPVYKRHVKDNKLHSILDNLDHRSYANLPITFNEDSEKSTVTGVYENIEYDKANNSVKIGNNVLTSLQANKLPVYKDKVVQAGQPPSKVKSHDIAYLSLSSPYNAKEDYDRNKALPRLSDYSTQLDRKLILIDFNNNLGGLDFTMIDGDIRRKVSFDQLNDIETDNTLLVVPDSGFLNNLRGLTGRGLPADSIETKSLNAVRKLLLKTKPYHTYSDVSVDNHHAISNCEISRDPKNPNPNEGSSKFYFPFTKDVAEQDRQHVIMDDIQFHSIHYPFYNPTNDRSSSQDYGSSISMGQLNDKYAEYKLPNRFYKARNKLKAVSKEIKKDILFVTTEHDVDGKFVKNSPISLYYIKLDNGVNSIVKVDQQNIDKLLRGNPMIIMDSHVNFKKKSIVPDPANTANKVRQSIFDNRLLHQFLTGYEHSNMIPQIGSNEWFNTCPPLKNGLDDVFYGDDNYFCKTVFHKMEAHPQTATIPVPYLVEKDKIDTDAKKLAVIDKLKINAKDLETPILSLSKTGDTAKPIKYTLIDPLTGNTSEVNDFKVLSRSENIVILHSLEKDLIQEAIDKNDDFKQYLTRNLYKDLLPKEVVEDEKSRQLKLEEEKRKKDLEEVKEIKKELKEREEDLQDRLEYKPSILQSTEKKIITITASPVSSNRLYQVGKNKLLRKGSFIKDMNASRICIKDKELEVDKNMVYLWPSDLIDAKEQNVDKICHKLKKISENIGESLIFIDFDNMTKEVSYYHVTNKEVKKSDNPVSYNSSMLVVKNPDVMKEFINSDKGKTFLSGFDSDVKYISRPNEELLDSRPISAKVENSILGKERFNRLSAPWKIVRGVSWILSLGVLPLISLKYSTDKDIVYKNNHLDTWSSRSHADLMDYHVRELKTAEMGDMQWRAKNDSIQAMLTNKKGLLNEESHSYVKVLTGQSAIPSEMKYFSFFHWMMFCTVGMITFPFTKSISGINKLSKKMMTLDISSTNSKKLNRVLKGVEYPICGAGKFFYNLSEWFAAKISNHGNNVLAKDIRNASYKMEYENKLKTICENDKDDKVKEAYKNIEKKLSDLKELQNELNSTLQEFKREKCELKSSRMKESKSQMKKQENKVIDVKKKIGQIRKKITVMEKSIAKVQRKDLLKQHKKATKHAESEQVKCTGGQISLTNQMLTSYIKPDLSKQNPVVDIDDLPEMIEIEIASKKSDILDTGPAVKDVPKFKHISAGEIDKDIMKKVKDVEDMNKKGTKDDLSGIKSPTHNIGKTVKSMDDYKDLPY